MNILFTSSGRRGYLLQYFREALGETGLIHASNNQPLVSSFAYADFTVQAPLIYDPEYVPFLLRYCEQHQIDAIIPLFDIGLPTLSKNRNKFYEIGVNVVVSDEAFIEVCNDKWETGEFLDRHGFKTPKMFYTQDTTKIAIQNKEINFPLFIKPRWGMGSIGVHRANDIVELDFYFNLCKKEVHNSYLKYESQDDPERSVVIQEQLPGEEFGLDVINDLKGNHVTVFVKKKLAMRAGETDAAITVDDGTLQQIGKKLGETTGHRGVLDIDVFYDGSNAYILDMNARFGGGYPFSHIAGADIPQAIIHWLRNTSAPSSCFTLQANVSGVKDVLPIPL